MREVRSLVVLMAIASSACGGGSSPVSPAPAPTPVANRPPTITAMTITPTVGVADLQMFSFSVAASDPDGDALSYLWDLGYGTGETHAARTFQATYGGGSGGVVPVSVRVSDGRGESVSSTVTIVLSSLNGLWRVSSGGGILAGTLFGLRQDEAGAVTGQYQFPNTASVNFDTPGTITAAGAVTLTVRVSSSIATFTGTMDLSTGQTITGTVSGAGMVAVPFTLVKS